MKEDDLADRIMTILRTIARRTEPIRMETNLREEMGFDSLTTLMAMNELDDAFGIEINEQDFNEVLTVADVVRLLRKNYLEPAEPHDNEMAHETGMAE